MIISMKRRNNDGFETTKSGVEMNVESMHKILDEWRKRSKGTFFFRCHKLKVNMEVYTCCENFFNCFHSSASSEMREREKKNPFFLRHA